MTQVIQPQADEPQGNTNPEEPSGYGAALNELESILRELDRDDVDVDVLGERVRRAAQLLRFCRDRIASARFEVEHVVAELEENDDTQGAGG